MQITVTYKSMRVRKLTQKGKKAKCILNRQSYRRKNLYHFIRYCGELGYQNIIRLFHEISIFFHSRSPTALKNSFNQV